MATQTVRTTLALPVGLLAAVDQAGQARSRNEWVARALQRELAAQQRAAIDAGEGHVWLPIGVFCWL